MQLYISQCVCVCARAVCVRACGVCACGVCACGVCVCVRVREKQSCTFLQMVDVRCCLRYSQLDSVRKYYSLNIFHTWTCFVKRVLHVQLTNDHISCICTKHLNVKAVGLF